MQEQTRFKLTNIAEFKQKALLWAEHFQVFACLDSNNYPLDQYSNAEWMLAIDALDSIECKAGSAFDQLKNFYDKKKGRFTFGFLGYDLKNEVEKLSSDNSDSIELPDLFFFEPRYLIRIEHGYVVFNRNYPEAFHLFDSIQKISTNGRDNEKIELQLTTNKADYLKNVAHIRQHIEEGDVYEMNYCLEFEGKAPVFDPQNFFNILNQKAQAPFSAFVKKQSHYIMCASPERFLKKTGNKLISQPIKGTIKKGRNEEENIWLKAQLYHDRKERAENIMIVDLVRNDLTRSAKSGTIKVEELCRVYEFATINQMISTVSAEIREDVHPVDAIKNAFPMGSMTGAPKVKAMKLIEHYENSKRGVYSGAIGYFSPEGDFDFNVVIRTLIYNGISHQLSLHAGGAITYDSIPEKEFEEIMVKAAGILQLLEA
jgi:para-aminobenzoate synthetase component I